MIKFPDGRIQALDIAWDTHSKEEGGQRWFHLHPDEEITPKHIFHWTRRFLNWNYMCAECHTTNLQKNYDLESNTFKTTWSEIDVGCQACHGPGSNHVEWAHYFQDTGTKKDRYINMGLEVNLKADDSQIQVEACARCHSRRSIVTGNYEYGKDLMDFYVPQVLVGPYYYADGQILEEVYVYGSFIQSKKYHQGVRCTDCHNPHTAKLRIPGNDLCNGCHGLTPSKQFKTIKPENYDSPEHHFHKQDSKGSLCVECHMPETKYMVVDPRRDHSFCMPRPDLTVKLGIPNACNRCHEDKTSQWSTDKVNEWYPLTKEIRENEIHFAEIFTEGQSGKPEAGPWLIKLAKDASQPAITRATALHILQRFNSSQTLNVISSSLNDASPLIRYESVRGVSALIPKMLETELQQKKLSLLAPLLNDPIRAVRTEAARALTEVPANLIDQAQLHNFGPALAEYKQRQQSIADRPESHLNLGLIYQNLGQNVLAETSYKNAIRLVSDFMPARFNLANFYNAIGRNKEAEQQFKQIVDLEPDNGEAYYSLGLLLAEMNRLDDAAGVLVKAVELIPDRPRIRYNYSLVLQHIGRNTEAEIEMLKAHQIDQSDPGFLHALTVFYMQHHQWEKAMPYAQKLVELAPELSDPKQMLKHIQQEMSDVN